MIKLTIIRLIFLLIIILSILIWYICINGKKKLKVYRVTKRRKVLLERGFKEIPYGFCPEYNSYGWGFQKGNKIFTAVDLSVLNNKDFYLKLQKYDK